MAPKNWTVLLVEDDHDSVQMVTKILSHSGAKVEVAHNGRECLENVEAVNPTLIVMDLAMPEMDGWETLVELRANPSTAHIPVVAITAYHSGECHFTPSIPAPRHPITDIAQAAPKSAHGMLYPCW